MDQLLLIGIGLMFLGLLLIVIEAFVPSGGVLGVAALASAVAGIVFLFRHDTTWGVIGVLAAVVLGPMVFFWSLKMLPHTPIGRGLIGDTGEDIQEKRMADESRWREARTALIDKTGDAVTDLIPAGVVMIDGERHDVVAKGGLVDRGERVRVVSVDGFEIVVRRVES